MPRSRRRITSNRPYEICLRARNGLPFVAYKLMELVIGSVLARAQRDHKVELCHDIWEGSHAHILIVSRDADQCKKFYMEVKKKVTDILKRLLGLPYLNLWERTTVAEILDIEKVKGQIAYYYSNPAQDNLEECIERFPGYSSWKDFQKCKDSLQAKSSSIFPWLRLPTIPTLCTPVLTSSQDYGFVKLLKKKNRQKHTLERKPNAWMKCFGVTDDVEVREANQEIIDRIRRIEANERAIRQREGRKVMGTAALCSQPILKPHIPKKKERKVYVLSSIKELRIAFIDEFKDFCRRCSECYKAWLRGDFGVEWPPGAFKPPLPPHANLLQA